MRSLASLLLLMCAAAKAQWPVPANSSQAYDFVQERREEAAKLWPARDPQGIVLLNDLLAYLDQPLVRDLGAGDRPLAARRLNVLLDLAQAYAVRENNGEALRCLRQVAKLWPNPDLARFIDGTKEFTALHSSNEYKQILAEFRRFEHLWDSEELHTPFRAMLPDAEKLAGLSKFWSEVKYNFAYPEKLIDLGWDRVYLESIPKVLAARTTAEYYQELMLLAAKLGDGHTNVYPPDQLDRSAKPPLRTLKVENSVMIVAVMSPTLESQGIHAGMEIVTVDGESPIAYGRREIEPFQSASTPQDRELRTFSYGFVRGSSGSPVRLLLRGVDGSEKEFVVARGGYNDVQTTPALEWRMLPGRVALVNLNSFESDGTAARFAEELPRFINASAVILDLRWNGGGSSSVGYEVLRHFIDKPVKTSREVMRRYNPTDRARGTLLEWEEVPAGAILPGAVPRFKGPAIVLTSAATFSAAEDFLVAWRNSGRGKVIGETSGGSTGQPLFFSLPGGGTARVCTKRDTFPDGREWVGIGIHPDIEVHPSIRDVFARKDTVLERALKFLASGT